MTIREEIVQLFGLMMTRPPLDKVTIPPVTVFPVDELVELFQSHLQESLERVRGDTDALKLAEFLRTMVGEDGPVTVEQDGRGRF